MRNAGDNGVFDQMQRRTLPLRRGALMRSLPGCIVFAFVLLATCSQGFADTATLTPVADNTLFSSKDGSRSNGAGTSVFCGRTGPGSGGTQQRAVLLFDVAASVPAGALITNVSLTMTLESSGGGAGKGDSIAMHSITKPWGEGTSVGGGGQGAPATIGDATWLHTHFPDQFWSQAGGDFEAVAFVATAVSIEPGTVTWSSAPAFVQEVQQWLDDPMSNHGCLLLGPEDVFQTARRFASRESAIAEARPTLVVTYDKPAETCSADIDLNNIVDVADLLVLLLDFGPCLDCAADFDGNDVVDVVDLLYLLNNWGPCP